MKKVGIVGLGLIGGSLAKALKVRCGFLIVATNRSEEPLKEALKDGVIDGYSLSIDGLFTGCDIVFVCTPVNKIAGHIKKLKDFVSPECIITDAGSTKETLYNDILEMGGVCYIGGHPMAGSEKTGYCAAKEYLFENAYYILTPLPSVPGDSVLLLLDILKRIGAVPIQIPADKHDFIVAAISHTPHIIASALTNTVKKLETGDNLLKTLAAGGFKDITRIASSSPYMWNSICIENKLEILKLIKEFEASIDEIKRMIDIGDDGGIFEFFDSAKNFRDSLDTAKSGRYISSYEVLLDVPDRPGSIATVATVLSLNNINIKNIGILNSREYHDGIMQVLLENENDGEKAVTLLKELNYNVYDKR